jgi:hypothetical protein
MRKVWDHRIAMVGSIVTTRSCGVSVQRFPNSIVNQQYGKYSFHSNPFDLEQLSKYKVESLALGNELY